MKIRLILLLSLLLFHELEAGEICPDGTPAGFFECDTQKAEDQCTDFELGCEKLADGKSYCCGKKKEAPPAEETKTCPDGVKAGFNTCGDDADCDDFELTCEETKEGGKACCGKEKEDPPAEETKTCPDGVKAGFNTCGDDADCDDFELTCEETKEGGKACCGKDKPEPTEETKTCPDGVKAGFNKCEDNADCDDFELTCEETKEGGKACCGKSPEPTKAPPVEETKTCPDGVKAGFNTCGDDADCDDFELTCEETKEGGKACCGKEKPEPTEVPPVEETKTCPDGVKAGFNKCEDDVDCDDFELTCEETKEGGKACCGKSPESTKAPPVEETNTCPDGVKAGFNKCEDDADCDGFELTCEETKEGGKACCGKDKPEPTEAPPVEETKTCPDGVKAGFNKCEDDADCDGFELTCEETKEGGKACCGKEKPEPTEAPPVEETKTCPDGVKAGFNKCEDDADCDDFELTCEETKEGGKACCGKEKPEPTEAPPVEETKTCPDGVKAGFNKCEDDADCDDFELTCEETKEGGKACCGKNKPEPTEAPPIEETKTCPDGVKAGFNKCEDDADCDDFELTCEETKEGGKACCGKDKTEPEKTTLAPTPVDTKTCPDGVKAGLAKCEDDADCDDFELTCENVKEGGETKYCCGKDKTEPEKTTLAPTPVDTKTCPDGVKAGFAKCEDDADCDDFELTCENVKEGGETKYCCGKGKTEPEKTTQAPILTEQCPDGVPAAFVPCSSQDECSLFNLDCIETESGKKHCCGRGGTTKSPDPEKTTKSPDPEKTTKTPDPQKTTQSPEETQAPETDSPEPVTKTPPVKGKLCPDGIPAGFVDCKDDDDCSEFNLTCEQIEGRGYCCGGGEKPVTEAPEPPTKKHPPVVTDKPVTDAPEKKTTKNPDDDYKCPDTVNVMAPCESQDDCDTFKLVCTDVKDKKFCCSGTWPVQTTEAPPAPTKKPTEAPEPEPTPKPTKKPTKKTPKPVKHTEPPEPEPTPKPAPKPTRRPPPPPPPIDNCQDVLGYECPKKAHLCNIPPYNRLVRQYCQRTCGFCPGPYQNRYFHMEHLQNVTLSPMFQQ